VFADPPYTMIEDPNARAEVFTGLEALVGRWIGEGATLILHHSPAPHMLWPAQRLRSFDQRIYGNSQLTFFEVAEGGDEQAD